MVEQDAKLVIEGHDPQLEKAVEVALELLKTQEVKLIPQPKDPISSKAKELKLKRQH
jgi:tricorn protease